MGKKSIAEIERIGKKKSGNLGAIFESVHIVYEIP
jgi:hypothetical protein